MEESNKVDPCLRDGPPILVEYKGEKTHYSFYLARTSNWGNPWDHRNEEPEEEFKVESPEEANENFRKWLWGEDFHYVKQIRRKWLLKNVKYLKGKEIAYDYLPYVETLIGIIDQDIPLPDVEDYEGQNKKDKPQVINSKEKVKKKSIF